MPHHQCGNVGGPYRVKSSYRLWTSDRRLRHGLQDESCPCFLCDEDEDTVDHLLMKCIYARQVWYLCFRKARINWKWLPSRLDRLETWWSTTRKLIATRYTKGFDSLVTIVC